MKAVGGSGKAPRQEKDFIQTITQKTLHGASNETNQRSPSFLWAACSNRASGIGKICIAKESFWLRDCASVDGQIFIGTIDNRPCATHLHGLRLGDRIHFVVTNPQKGDAQHFTSGASPSREDAMPNEGAASLAFTQCKVILSDRTIIVADLHYVAYAYSRGLDQYPANLVQFTPEQLAQISAILEEGEGADFIAECINCAIAEGDCTAGTISFREEYPTKEIHWALLS